MSFGLPRREVRLARLRRLSSRDEHKVVRTLPIGNARRNSRESESWIRDESGKLSRNPADAGIGISTPQFCAAAPT
jgi:hypothetical protein